MYGLKGFMASIERRTIKLKCWSKSDFITYFKVELDNTDFIINFMRNRQ